MRTKTTLLTAALVAAGAATSMAQVYSLNVVGYINVAVTNGFQMIACPLQCSPDNTVATLFGNPPAALTAGSTLYKFSNATGLYTPTIVNGKNGNLWSDATVTLNPGEGAFLLYKGATATSGTNVTFVGQVPQAGASPLSNPIAAGFQIVSPQVPVAGGLQTTLNYQPSKGDNVYEFDPSVQTYSSVYTFGAKTGAWNNEPPVAVGQSFFLFTTNGVAWTNNFTVH